MRECPWLTLPSKPSVRFSKIETSGPYKKKNAKKLLNALGLRQAFPDFGIFFYDDIKKDPLGLARSVYRFIDVDNGFTPDISHWPLKGEYKSMPPIFREMLVDFYREQIVKFSAMTGRGLSDWLKV
jgi:hypothetical protein